MLQVHAGLGAVMQLFVLQQQTPTWKAAASTAAGGLGMCESIAWSFPVIELGLNRLDRSFDQSELIFWHKINICLAGHDGKP